MLDHRQSFEEICRLTLEEKDREFELGKILLFHTINFRTMSVQNRRMDPVMFLSAQNEIAGARFLVQKFGAKAGSFLQGLAIAGNTSAVYAGLEQGIHPAYAARGWAMRGEVSKVNRLLVREKNQQRIVDAAAQGYAEAGLKEETAKLLELGASLGKVIKIYAKNGCDIAEKTLNEVASFSATVQANVIEGAIIGYALKGDINNLFKALQACALLIPQSFTRGLYQAVYYSAVEGRETLLQVLYNKYKNKYRTLEFHKVMLRGYIKGEHLDLIESALDKATLIELDVSKLLLIEGYAKKGFLLSLENLLERFVTKTDDTDHNLLRNELMDKIIDHMLIDNLKCHPASSFPPKWLSLIRKNRIRQRLFDAFIKQDSFDKTLLSKNGWSAKKLSQVVKVRERFKLTYEQAIFFIAHNWFEKALIQHQLFQGLSQLPLELCWKIIELETAENRNTLSVSGVMEVSEKIQGEIFRDFLLTDLKHYMRISLSRILSAKHVKRAASMKIEIEQPQTKASLHRIISYQYHLFSGKVKANKEALEKHLQPLKSKVKDDYYQILAKHHPRLL